MKPLVCAALVSCLAAGCIKDVRYRYFDDLPCPAQKCLPAREDGAGWELIYVEFNDDGKPWDGVQTDRAIDLIKQAKADNGGAAVVLLYVHGWKNSANEAPPGKQKDVEKFHTALNAVAAAYSRPAAPGKKPPLVGIYIGWRGGTVSVEPIKTLTFWPRRATARNVGRRGLFDTVGRIVDAAKPPGDAKTKLILVGHSFGSRVLENAVNELDARNTKEGPLLAWQKTLPETPGAVAPAPPADLVLFVNAATQSSISEKTIARLRDKHVVFYGPDGSPEACRDDPAGDRRPECRPLPLYIAVSSTGDTATRYVLPTANTIVPPPPLPLRVKSAAFTSGLRSHEVKEVECPALAPYRCQPSGDTEFCFEANRDEQRVCYDVNRIPGAANKTPFWVMTVDPRVVTDHGDIWNQNLLDLFSSVLLRSRAADVTATRTMRAR